MNIPWTKKQIETIHEVKIKGPSEMASCFAKRFYVSQKFALSVSQRMNRDKGGERFNAYKCRYCNNYHVGHELAVKGLNR